MKTRLPAVFFLLVIFSFFFSVDLLACSAKGPADPVTGLITYPNGRGRVVDGEQFFTEVPNTAKLKNTPFAGGKFYKGWNGTDDMNIIVVPNGTSLVFDGIIQDDKTEPPPDWEEGKLQGLKGTTIDKAPVPKWTISGNGRGDFRDGVVPPENINMVVIYFESPPSAVLKEQPGITGEDSPDGKAEFRFSYDPEAARLMLKKMLSDPLRREMIKASISSSNDLPSDFDIDAVVDSTKEPEGDKGTKLLDEEKISAEDEGSFVNLKKAFDELLPHRTNEIIESGMTDEREYIDKVTGDKITRTYATEAIVVLKAGIIGNKDWYSTGRYTTKYFVTHPGGDEFDEGENRDEIQADILKKSFNAPTAPSYWTIDLHSGLESQRDIVYCWIEGKAKLRPDGDTIDNIDDIKEFYTLDADSYAIGGVLIVGNYDSGNSSTDRNTKVHVVVADTEAPAHYEWNTTKGKLFGETGGFLQTSYDKKTIDFTVYDNNPIIAAMMNGDEFPNIMKNEDIGDISELEFVEAGKRGKVPADKNIYNKYLLPVKEGFDAKNLNPIVHYNTCVPVYAGFVVNNSKKYTGLIPNVKNKIVVPVQKFVWQSTDPEKATISEFKLYDRYGNLVSSSDDLKGVGGTWYGYSSYTVSYKPEAFTARFGNHFAQNSLDYWIDIGTHLKAQSTNKDLLSTGVPIQGSTIKYFGWGENSLKLFVEAADGLCYYNQIEDKDIFLNRSPDPANLKKLLDSKYSGITLNFKDKKSKDYLCYWKDADKIGDLNKGELEGTFIPGGGLGGCQLPPPTEVGAPPKLQGYWGKFEYISKVTDIGRPNVALEILNSKNEKKVIYGNILAAGENEKMLTALHNAGSQGDDWLQELTAFEEDADYSSNAENQKDENWEFKDELTNDLYMDMKNSMDDGKFQPWLWALDDKWEKKFWNSNDGYWNGSSGYSHKRLAFQQGSRDRLVFRYWAWDNINTFANGGNYPQGIKLDTITENAKFRSVNGNVTAEVIVKDVPGRGGEVAKSSVWWPDYIFHNPSLDGKEECSITLKAQDEAGLARTLKVWFRILPPSKEIIRTLEDKRKRFYQK